MPKAFTHANHHYCVHCVLNWTSRARVKLNDVYKMRFAMQNSAFSESACKRNVDNSGRWSKNLCWQVLGSHGWFFFVWQNFPPASSLLTSDHVVRIVLANSFNCLADSYYACQLKKFSSTLAASVPQFVGFLVYSCYDCFQDTVDVFLSRSNVKDEADNEGRTAFLWAAGNGSDDVVSRFIKRNVDLFQMDKTGATGC